MRKSPQFLALFALSITIYRAYFLAVDGFGMGVWMSRAIAFLLAAGVYVFAYFAFRAKTWWVALPALAAFVLADLAFNLTETVRTLSTANFVPTNANFLAMSAADIQYIMQWIGLVIGSFPTLASVALGILQSRSDAMDWSANRHWLEDFRLAIMARFTRGSAEYLDYDQPNAKFPTAKTPVIEGRVKMITKENVTAEQKSALPAMTDGQIVALFGGSPRRARQWRTEVKNGKW